MDPTLAQRYSSRTLALAVLLIVLATVLLLMDAVSEAMWWNVVQLAGGGYLGANVAQKAVAQIAQALSGAKAAASQPGE